MFDGRNFYLVGRNQSSKLVKQQPSGGLHHDPGEYLDYSLIGAENAVRAEAAADEPVEGGIRL
jgi:hypothetical protein